MVEKEASVFCIDVIKTLLEGEPVIRDIFLQRMADSREMRNNLRVLMEATSGLAKTVYNICPLPDPLKDCPRLIGKPCQIKEIVS